MLSPFCTQLTGITQVCHILPATELKDSKEQVDQGVTLASALMLFEEWLEKHNFVGLKFGPKGTQEGNSFAILTDGCVPLPRHFHLLLTNFLTNLFQALGHEKFSVL